MLTDVRIIKSTSILYLKGFIMFDKRDLNLLWELTISDFKLKYSDTILGFFWSLINPLLMLLTLFIVFSILIDLGIPHYQLFLLLGIVIWNFFSESTTNSMISVLSKRELIKKVYFPRVIIVLASCFTSLISFILNLGMFFIFMLVFKVRLGWSALAFTILLLELFLLVVGLSLALSALYVRYRDMLYVWQALLQVGFWISPIIYSVWMIPEVYAKWYMLNPIARIINDSRDAIIFHYVPSMWHMSITLIICVVIFVAGYSIFDRMSPYFAEEL